MSSLRTMYKCQVLILSLCQQTDSSHLPVLFMNNAPDCFLAENHNVEEATFQMYPAYQIIHKELNEPVPTCMR